MSKDRIIVYKGKMELLTEFHSGAFGGNIVTDHPLIRDTAGQVILRGESLAGLIRQELIRCFGYECEDFNNPDKSAKEKPCRCQACELMGHSRIPEKESMSPEDELAYHSSRIKITGGIFKNGQQRIRHGVAIERRFNVAAKHKKYDLEALLPGALADFELEIEDPTEQEIGVVERILSEMMLGFVSLGGRKGPGFGGITIKELFKYSYDLDNKQEVIDYLLSQEQCKEEFTGSSNVNMDSSSFSSCAGPLGMDNDCQHRGYRLIVPFDLWFPELFLVNDPLEAAFLGSDHVSVVDGNGNPWLPPSTIRGVLRNRGEQILRTLNEQCACDPSRDKVARPMLSCSAGIEALREGKGKEWPTHNDLEGPDFVCLGCQLFGCAFRASNVRFQSGNYCKDKSHRNVLNHFLAIDRFKGGGKEHAKFDAWPLYNVGFSDCRVIIENYYPWQIGLLALVFKDLFQSDIRMGFGTRKGFGQVAGSFDPEKDVLLSAPDGIYWFKIKEFIEGAVDAVDPLKTLLENSVTSLRKRAQEFKGTTYEA